VVEADDRRCCSHCCCCPSESCTIISNCGFYCQWKCLAMAQVCRVAGEGRVIPANLKALEAEGFQSLSTTEGARRQFNHFCPFGTLLKKVSCRVQTYGVKVQYQYKCCPGCILVCHWEIRSNNPRQHGVEFSMAECHHVNPNPVNQLPLLVIVSAASCHIPLPRLDREVVAVGRAGLSFFLY
jgi:hypothetical protein